MSEVVFYDSTYTPPKVAVAMGAFLRGPRELGHSTNFTDLFSSIREEQRDYIDGLMVVSILFSFVFLIWAFVLIVLKFKGKEVGCASGHAFVSRRPEDENDEIDLEKTQDDIGSTSDSSNAESVYSNNPLFSKNGGALDKNSSSDENGDNNDSKRSWRCMRRANTEKGARNNRRERRTRIVFLVFASVALICTPFTLFLTFGPLKEALMEVTYVESPDSAFLNIQNIVNDMEKSLSTIASLSSNALELVDEVPTDLDIICPLVNTGKFSSFLGVDIYGIIATIVDQQYHLREDIEAKLSVQQSFADRIENVLSIIESYAYESEKYLMILPGLLLTIGSLTMIAILSVVLAWKERSSVRVQRCMSYIVLPLLILAATTCWIMLMALSLSTMIGTDICLSSSPNGSPDETILQLLSTVGNGTNGTTYQVASTYINQCHGPDPTQSIQDLKLETQEDIDNIWRQVSKIDSVGRADVLEKCGNTQEFQEMLSGARDLAMSLTNIRRELSSLAKSMKCSSIHPIYTQTSHDILCTETLSASVYGFVMFLIMWICLMIMISLRASWLGNIDEEKVYHDETEVAENMVVDEHEEYLAYISRYKHEWQEYEGFEEDGALKSSTTGGRSLYADCSEYYYDDAEYDSHVSESDLSTMDSETIYVEDGPQEELPSYTQHTADRIIDHHDEGVSYASGKISFTTFSSERANNEKHHSHILTLPSSDMPPPMNPELYDVHDESSTLPSLTTTSTPDDWDYSNVGSSRQKKVSSGNDTEKSLSISGRQRMKSLLSARSASTTDECNGKSDGDCDDHHFEKYLSHDLQSTGEVEVQLNENS